MKKTILLMILACIFVIVGCSKTEGKPQTNYPNKTIELIVPYAAGGATDLIARLLADNLPKYLPKNQPIVVINKPGAGGIVGATDVFNAKPDGYKLGVLTHGVVGLQPLYGKAAYTHESFRAIAKATSTQQVLFVKGDAPWKTFDEWLDYVKKNPGQFTYGVAAGIGSAGHIPMAMLDDAAGLQTKVVAFDGTPPVISAVLGGHVMGGVGQPNDVKSQVEEGKLRVLINTGSKPIPFMKEVPSLKDKGHNISMDTNTSIFAPKGLPLDIAMTLQEAIKKALDDPNVVDGFKKINLQTDYLSGADVQKQLNEEVAVWKEVVKKLGLNK